MPKNTLKCRENGSLKMDDTVMCDSRSSVEESTCFGCEGPVPLDFKIQKKLWECVSDKKNAVPDRDTCFDRMRDIWKQCCVNCSGPKWLGLVKDEPCLIDDLKAYNEVRKEVDRVQIPIMKEKEPDLKKEETVKGDVVFKSNAPGEETCSFCGKRMDEIKELIAHDGHYICDECIMVCIEILQKEGVMAVPQTIVVKEEAYKERIVELNKELDEKEHA